MDIEDAAGGVDGEAARDEVEIWLAEERHARRQRWLRGGIVLTVGTALLAALALTGHPATGIDPAAVRTSNPEARLVWHPTYGMPWFDRGSRMLLRLAVGDHAVPIDRFPKLTSALIDSGQVTVTDLVRPTPLTREQVERVHDPAYLDELDRLTEGWLLPEGLTRRGENRINADLYAFIQASSGGTLEAGRIALQEGVAMNLAGGYHHAYPDHEEGFCFVNDVAIAIEVLRAEGRIERAMIVDLDTHHGNGNAAVFRGRDDVAIFDIYEADNYPRPKVPVSYPVALDAGVDDREYLEEMEGLVAAVAQVQPDLLFYIAGADPFEGDVLGNQRLTRAGLRERDEVVLEVCRALQVPCAVVLGGGYSTAAEVAAINASTALTVLERGESPTREGVRRRVAAQAASLPASRAHRPWL